ncbi:MAG: hypothetical protein HY020_23315 [Burkholderiales bacterium]|nr:hypothetical protein [Burkholderiales bacterium]
MNCPPEVFAQAYARAMRTALEQRHERPPRWVAAKSIASKIIRTPQTLRTCVRQPGVEIGQLASSMRCSGRDQMP